MQYDSKAILDHYRSYDEDQRATSSRANGLEFRYTKKMLQQHLPADAKVIELGCGTGYYGMFLADKCAQYTGIDLSPDNISIFRNKISAARLKHVNAFVGNALELSDFPDCSFDVVLCLGPMYHLPREKRKLVFEACRRVARKGSLLAFAYINSLGAYMGWCVNDEWRELYPSAEANQCFLEHQTAHDNPDLFFLSSPEEMEQDAKFAKLQVIENRGLDYFFAQSAINAMSEKQFAAYLQLADRLNESPSCVGLADHALMICRKEAP